MTKHDKIKYAQSYVSKALSCPDDSFSRKENIIFETNNDSSFFKVITFGNNAVIAADKAIFTWCVENFSKMSFSAIMDGENLYAIENKVREYGKKLGGEHLRFLRLNEDVNIPKPQGFKYELCEKERIAELYQDKRFDSALNYGEKGEVLAIVAKKDNEIAAIVAVDDYHDGFWQIGIDTVDIYRGKGLAAYLVNEMALECERRGKVPFYTTWSANIASIRTALAAGFQPVWLEYFAEEI